MEMMTLKGQCHGCFEQVYEPTYGRPCKQIFRVTIARVHVIQDITLSQNP
jgi:hypothetical protein